MGDFRNRFCSTRSQLRPKFFSAGSPGSRRVQSHGFSTNISAAQPEAIEIVDGCETGTLRMEDHPEATLSLSHVHPLSRLSFKATTSTHGTVNPYPFPIWGRAGYDTSSSFEGRTMGESADRVKFPNGRAISLSTRDPMMATISGRGISLSEDSQALSSIGLVDPVNGLIGESGRAVTASDINRFSQAPPSYSCTQVPATFVYPVGMVERYNPYHLNDNYLRYEANTIPNYGATSTSSGSYKRKLSALECPINGAQGVSTDICNYPTSYDPLLSRSANNDRIHVGPSSPNPIFFFSESSMGQTVVPLNAVVDGLRIPTSEEPHVYQGSGFPRDVPNPSCEPLRGSHLFGTSMLGSVQMESPAPQVQLWVSGRRQEVAPSANLNLTRAQFADFIPTINQLSGPTHGGVSCPILTQGRQNELPRVQGDYLGSQVLENEIDNSYLTFRHGQTIASNQTYYEGARAVGSSQNYIANDYSSESRIWINCQSHPMSSVSALQEVPLSDYHNGRRPFCPPWTQNMELNYPTIRSATLLPSAAPPSSMVILPTFGGPHSTSHLFRMPPVESSLEHRGDSFLSAAGRMPVGFPFHRVYGPRVSDNHGRQDISNGAAERTSVIERDQRVEESTYEQLLMLDSTVLFGDSELQDQHSDWRLDVDNMSYEELLALEERIGNVCTGVSEDAISKKLKIGKYSSKLETASASQETEAKCTVCQEEYEEEDDLGRLKCGHSYHAVCIRQWLVKKNQCPVCKASAFSS